MTKSVGKENTLVRMDIYMKEVLWTIKRKEKGNRVRMNNAMKVNGRTIWRMGKGRSYSRMEIYSKDSSTMTRSRGMESTIPMKTDVSRSTRESGWITICREYLND